MARPFDFPPDVAATARLRQDGCCAVLGCELDDTVEHAHHVIPNQSGDPKSAADIWLRSSDNCVILCADCHTRVHENGRYRAGAVAPPGYFRFSHGEGDGAKRQHQAWVQKLDALAGPIWRRLQGR